MVQMKQTTCRYLKGHRISDDLAARTKDFVDRYYECTAMKDHLEQEIALLDRLPPDLQCALQWEARTRVLLLEAFCLSLYNLSDVALRHLCTSSMSDLLLQEKEIAFSAGSSCTRVLFLDAG